MLTERAGVPTGTDALLPIPVTSVACGSESVHSTAIIVLELHHPLLFLLCSPSSFVGCNAARHR